ncbi:nucleoside hydrolase [Fictibacillus sp. B-59209]|uniref:nucleoside hydrolase n=1 Tax=Fictibacillus sp. B-59209 TaxID=3024873 RepID=UPI002E1C8A62|nr:nucleoside hydrolase [Fictibacillus sp. B-59209]
MNVLFFTDLGIDDAFALIYALKHPQIKVIGIVADYGNVSRDRAIRNAQYILTMTNSDHIPIISGASRPVLGTEPEFFPYVHGTEGLGTVIPEEMPKVLYNFSNIFTVIKESTEPVSIVNIGRLTSLAMAFILHPELLNLVQNIYVMGGAFLVRGNVTPYAEANIFGDPTSASIVINHTSPLAVRLFPLNVTEKAIATPQFVQSLIKGSEDSTGHFLRRIYEFYYTFYKKERPGLRGAPIHDLVPVSALVNPSIFKYVERNVQIVENSSIFGKGITVADFREHPVINPSENDFSIIAYDMDYDAFLKDVYTVMRS